MKLEKKSKRQLALEFMEDFNKYGTSENEDDIYYSKESLKEWVAENWACCGCGMCMRVKDAIKELEGKDETRN